MENKQPPLWKWEAEPTRFGYRIWITNDWKSRDRYFWIFGSLKRAVKKAERKTAKYNASLLASTCWKDES